MRSCFGAMREVAPWLQVIIIAVGEDYGKANAKICSGGERKVEHRLTP